MIEQPAYLQASNTPYDMDSYQEPTNEQNMSCINQVSTQLRSSSKKQAHDLKIIKHLKSKDIKLSHKKIIAFSSKISPNLKHGSSFEHQTENAPQSNSPQTKPSQQSQLLKIIKKKKSQNSQKLKQKQKSSEPATTFNPETMIQSKQGLNLTREKAKKKLKSSELTNLQHRVRQSRSQNKRQKIHNLNSVSRNQPKNSYENQPNIFQNIDIFAKQNSHHSLDKNQQLTYAQQRFGGPMSFKIEEKLHLPSLVSNSGIKNVKSKIHQNINEHNETEMQKSHFYMDSNAKTEKSTPYIQKIVKIPIERLKPLKPEQIKLKYQQKVKEQQKNRAKQRAIQIFEKDEEEAEKRKLLESKKTYELESDQNSYLYETENKKIENSEPTDHRNKNSLIKQEKFTSNKGENIFKKKLIAYNGQY